jgi:hypothetical protein
LKEEAIHTDGFFHALKCRSVKAFSHFTDQAVFLGEG